MHEKPVPKILTAVRSIAGEVTVPGDKSISHRSIMLGSLGKGVTRITNFLRGDDNFSTMQAFRNMGVLIDDDGQNVTVHGAGLHGLKEPEDLLDCGNSGTTMRLMAGLLSGQDFFSVLTGDRFLRKRPMKRVIDPLTIMGAKITGRGNGTVAPLAITGNKLKGISYSSPISSAQVKSALMLAGLYADGETRITEPALSRDHSERMFRHFGADLEILSNGVTVRGGKALYGQDIQVPGDISSAAFLLVAGLITPGAELLIKNTGVNRTRTGLIDILLAMGGDIRLENQRELSGEPVADIYVRHSSLKGVEIAGEVVSRAIDEFPALFIAAACAEGETVVRDASELRVKETDRIAAMADNLRRIGVSTVTETADGVRITGGETLQGGSVSSYGDHRIAMAMSVAALVCKDEVKIDDTGCVAVSFPGFYELLDRVTIR